MSQLLEYLPETEKTYYRESLPQYQRGKLFAKFNWPAFILGHFWMFYRKMYGIGFGFALAEASIGKFIPKFFNKACVGYVAYIELGLIFLLHLFIGFYGTAMYAEFLEKRIKKGKPYPSMNWWNTSLIIILFIIGNISLFKFGK